MVDVVILGLGAMGSAAAQHLAQRGRSVLGFDQYTPPHGHGSSHGRSRIYRQAYFEDVRYVPMLLRAFELWQRLEHDTGEHLLHLTGALVLGSTHGQLVQRSQESAERFQLPYQLLDAAELRRRYPAFALTPESLGLLEQNAGYLVPEACIEAQLREAARAGAVLHTGEQVLDWRAEPGDGVTVRTTAGTYAANHLVITAGPWAPQLLRELHLPMRVTRQVLHWFEPRSDRHLYSQDRMPVYLIEAEDGQPMVYGFPLSSSDTEGVKVAIHGTEEICTPESVDREIRSADEQYIRQRLATVLPDLPGRLLHSETCLYTMTPDENFILAPHPQHGNVILAAGFSGHGFKFAPVIGEAIADMVTAGSSPYAYDFLSLARFTAHAS